jgi:hypothetical protein
MDCDAPVVRRAEEVVEVSEVFTVPVGEWTWLTDERGESRVVAVTSISIEPRDADARVIVCAGRVIVALDDLLAVPDFCEPRSQAAHHIILLQPERTGTFVDAAFLGGIAIKVVGGSSDPCVIVNGLNVRESVAEYESQEHYDEHYQESGDPVGGDVHGYERIMYASRAPV